MQSLTHINHLPEEIHLDIFHRLDTADLLSVRSVCKKWRRIANDEQLWASLALKKIPFLPKPDDVSWQDMVRLNAICYFPSKILADKKFVYSTFANNILVWRKNGFMPNLVVFPTDHKFSITCINIRKIGISTLFITGSMDKTIKVWQRTFFPYAEFELEQTISDHMAPISALETFNNYLASASDDGNIMLWTRNNEHHTGYLKLSEYKAHTRKITALNFAQRVFFLNLFSGSADKTIKVWSLAKDSITPVATLGEHSASISSLQFYQEDKALLSAAKDGKLIFWSCADFNNILPQQIIQHASVITKAALCQKKRLVIVSDGSDKVHFFKREKRNNRWRIRNIITLNTPCIDFVSLSNMHVGSRADEAYILTSKYVITYVIRKIYNIREISRFNTQLAI